MQSSEKKVASGKPLALHLTSTWRATWPASWWRPWRWLGEQLKADFVADLHRKLTSHLAPYRYADKIAQVRYSKDIGVQEK